MSRPVVGHLLQGAGLECDVGRPALPAEIDVHDLGEVSKRSQPRPEVALVEAWAAVDRDHGWLLGERAVVGDELGAVHVEVETGVIDCCVHIPWMQEYVESSIRPPPGGAVG